MKIAIDTQTTLGQKTGFGSYVKNLVENLKKIDPGDEYILVRPDTEKDFSTPQRFIWDQVMFPKIAKKQKADILHQPCFSAPLFYKGKVVVTCHDLIPLLFPKNLPLASRLYFARWMTFSYRAAKMIITDSEQSKKDIISVLKIPEKKIRVIHLAVSNEFRPIKSPKEKARIQEKYKTGSRYFIDVGTLEPRKNLPFLVRAFAIAAKKIPENLVITGKKGWYYEELFKLVKLLKLENRVIFTGYADEVDIPALYSGATALAFPSLYEGFGFAPLEAMACGTPVISSNTSSLPEVVGETGILLPPKNEELWANKMIGISQNKELAEKLIIAGLKQAKKFSWKETARKTIEVYKEVLESQK